MAVFGDAERVAHFVSIRNVTSGFFDATGVPLVAGRWFDESEFANGTTAVLINETLARQLFAGGNPLGQLLDWAEGGSEVVGVVGDIMGGSPDRPAPPAIYFPSAGNTGRAMSALVKTAGDPRSLVPTVRQSVERLDPQLPIFGSQTLQDIAVARLGTRRFAMSLFGVFAGLALLLGAVGIYGVMSFVVAQRSRELGVRLALGASRSSMMRLILSQSARLTIPGVLIGLVLALASARVLGNLLYEISALDPVTYVAVVALLILVSLAAAYMPARRATRVDPLTSIRNE
jgi:predicted permease